ncbi:MAG: hypothetical protein M0T79_07600 [Actinomycetota bacterium]|jgi:hypothetical protein|nr:hypothetical protein [Actinomycetota bacterium]
MADKSPKKTTTKKAGKSLKEKRAAKKQKSDPAVGASQMDALRANKSR